MIKANQIVLREEDMDSNSDGSIEDVDMFKSVHGIFIVKDFVEVTYEEGIKRLEAGEKVYVTDAGCTGSYMFFTGNITWRVKGLSEAHQVAGTVSTFDSPVKGGKLIVALRND